MLSSMLEFLVGFAIVAIVMLIGSFSIFLPPLES